MSSLATDQQPKKGGHSGNIDKSAVLGHAGV